MLLDSGANANKLVTIEVTPLPAAVRFGLTAVTERARRKEISAQCSKMK